MAYDVLNRTIPAEVAYSDAEFASVAVDRLFNSTQALASRSDPAGGDLSDFSQSSYFVCQAVIETLYDACGRFRFDHVLIEPDTLDADLDPWSTDVSGWVAMACAGPIWDTTSNPQERKQFWEWWLLEAIPAAYNEPNSR